MNEISSNNVSTNIYMLEIQNLNVDVKCLDEI